MRPRPVREAAFNIGGVYAVTQRIVVRRRDGVVCRRRRRATAGETRHVDVAPEHDYTGAVRGEEDDEDIRGGSPGRQADSARKIVAANAAGATVTSTHLHRSGGKS